MSDPQSPLRQQYCRLQCRNQFLHGDCSVVEDPTECPKSKLGMKRNRNGQALRVCLVPKANVAACRTGR